MGSERVLSQASSLSDLAVRSEGKQKLVSFCGRLRRIVVLFNEIDRKKWLISACGPLAQLVEQFPFKYFSLIF